MKTLQISNYNNYISRYVLDIIFNFESSINNETYLINQNSNINFRIWPIQFITLTITKSSTYSELSYHWQN